MPFSTELFSRLPIVGIMRGLPPEALEPVLNAVRDGGLLNLEITMNSRGAVDQIRAACALTGGALNVGAGTVTDVNLLEQALSAGASYIVTPTTSMTVIECCVQKQVPVFPGAFSPAEIARAWDLGAHLVKVFPADVLGPEYLRRLKTLFPGVGLMPTGGVDLVTLRSFAKAGADAFGVGTPLFRPDRIAAQDWAWLRNQCRAFRNAYETIH
jgi:2-dehydro-3-deoxyphosphogluconate aldolase / (4S)-4-hydroxy-2-oxoglutarate aldolase